MKNAASGAALLIAASLYTAQHAEGTVYGWDPGNTPATPAGGNGSWDLTSTVWSNGTTDNPWTDVAGVTSGGTDTDTAIFGGTAGMVTLNAPLGAAELIFNTPGYTLVSSGNINTSNGTGNILFLGTTTLALDATAIGSGTLTLPNVEIADSAIPATGQATTPSQTWNCGSAVITVGGELINFGASNSLTLNGTSTTTLAGGLALGYTTSNKKITFIGSENVNITGPVVNSINGSGGSSNTLGYNGTGTITLSGNNTYTGTTIFYSGTMALGSNTALSTSAFTFGEPSSTYTPVMPTATLMATGGPVTISNTTLIDSQVSPTNGFPLLDIIGGSNNLTFAGTVVGGTSVNELIVNNAAATTITGALDLSNSTSGRTLNIRGTGNLTVSGVVGDSNVSGGSPGSLTYNGAGGTLTQSGTNTYSGTTTLYSGTLAVANNLALGTSAFVFGDPSTTTLPASTTAILMAVGGPVTLANTIQLSSSSTAASPVLATIAGSSSLTLSGPLTSYSSTNVLAVNSTATTILSGPVYLSRNISSPGAITFTGSGNLTITGGDLRRQRSDGSQSR